MKRAISVVIFMLALCSPLMAQNGDASKPEFPYTANPIASITRTANTTPYTANTAWNNGTPTFFSFLLACRQNGGSVLIPQIDIWSSANPTTKLQGILWLFTGTPANIADNAAFNIAASTGNPPTGDFSLVTGNMQGYAFTLANDQSTGSNSAVSLAGTNYVAVCPSGSRTITGMVQVVNTYTPASGEVLTVRLNTLNVN